MIYALFVLLLLACGISYIEERISDKAMMALIIVAITLVCFATFKPIGIDNDSDVYELMFLNYDDPLLTLTVESSFKIISETIIKTIGPYVPVLFFIYAVLGVSVKFLAIRRLSPFVFLSIALYISNYYILHEFTQIRVGVAAALLLVALPSIAERRYGRGVAIILVATFFHYSSLLMLPLFLISDKPMSIRGRVLWAGIIVLGYLFYFSPVGITNLPIPYLEDKLMAYQELQEKGVLDEINGFNLVYLVRIAMYFYLLLMYDVIKEQGQYVTLMIKVMGISLFCFTFFSSLPVLAFRASELYGVVEMIALSYIAMTVKPLWLGKSVVVVIALALFAINVFYNDILHFA